MISYKDIYIYYIYIYIQFSHISRSPLISPSRSPLGGVFQQLLGHVPGRPRCFAEGQRGQGQMQTAGHSIRVALALQHTETSNGVAVMVGGI